MVIGAKNGAATVATGKASDALGGWACIALVVVTPLLFVRGTFTVFTIPKASFVVLVAALLVTAEMATLVAWGAHRRLDRRIEVLSGLLAVAVLIATMTSKVPAVALTGVGVRYSGAVTYLAYAVILRASACGLSRDRARHLIPALGGSGLVVVGYALLQAAGHDPLSWAPSLSFGVNTMSTFGNPNFASAFTAISLPFLVGLVLSVGRPVVMRIGSAMAIMPVLAALGHFSSLQGQVAILATGVLLLAWLWGRTGRVLDESILVCLALVVFLGVGTLVADRSWLLMLAGAVLMAGVAIALIGRERAWSVDALPIDDSWSRPGRRFLLLGIGMLPLLGVVAALGWDRIERALGERIWFWEVGVRLFLERPLTGHGLETYGTRFAELRPLEHAVVSPRHLSDSVHSVPVGLLVGGGLILAVVYLVIAAFAACGAVRAIRAATGDDRLVMAAVASAWLAFHLQSLVSVDEVGLGVIYWVLTGVLLGRGFDRPTRWLTLVWAPSRDGGQWVRTGIWVAVAIGLVAFWVGPVTAPLRADRAHDRAFVALVAGEVDEALARLEEARQLQSGNALYAAMEASLLRSERRLSEALAMSERAAELQPGYPLHALEAARDAVRVIGRRDNLGRAIRWYDEVVRIDPMGPWSEEAADFFEAIGRHDRAEELRNRQAAGPVSGG